MDPSLWDIDWSVGTPRHPRPYSDGSWYVDVPAASGADAGPTCKSRPSCPHLNMVVANPGGPLSGRLAADVQVEATPAPTYNFALDPTPPCAGDKALASLYFQQRGDDFSGQGKHQFYRWWSKRVIYLDELTSTTLSVTLETTNWISVYGKDGTQNPPAFAAAMADPVAVGLTFGGLCGSHHGLNVSGGTSRIIVLSYRME